MRNDLYSNILEAVGAIGAGQNLTTIAGAAIDLRGYDSCMVLVGHGASGTNWSNGAHITFSLQQSDTEGASKTWTAVADADVQRLAADAAVTDAGVIWRPENESNPGAVVKAFGYLGSARFVRCTITEVGTVADVSTFALVLRGHPTQAPVSR